MKFDQFFGWAGPQKAEAAWQQHKGFFLPSNAVPQMTATSPLYVHLWKFTKKVLGTFTKNYPQLTGDCVAAGAKNAVEYVQCVEIVKGDAEEFKPIFIPYHYATGRVLVGGNRLRGDAGSLGSWQAKASIEYGYVPTDTPGLPKYSKAVADAWGDDRTAEGGSFRDFMEVGKENLIKSAARLESVEAVFGANAAGYPVTIASNAGFEMKPGRDGYHRRSGTWPHQMTIMGGALKVSKPYVALLNTWGNVHGTVVDFETGEEWPAGTLRIHVEDAAEMIRSGEAFAYSQFDGFPMQNLPWGDLIG